jgi:hypothetical protein
LLFGNYLTFTGHHPGFPIGCFISGVVDTPVACPRFPNNCAPTRVIRKQHGNRSLPYAYKYPRSLLLQELMEIMGLTQAEFSSPGTDINEFPKSPSLEGFYGGG